MYLVILRKIGVDVYDNFLGCYKNMPIMYNYKVTRSGVCIAYDGTVNYSDDEELLVKKIEIADSSAETIYLLCKCMSTMGANSRVYQEYFTDKNLALSKTGKSSKFTYQRIYSLKINYEDKPIIDNSSAEKNQSTLHFL